MANDDKLSAAGEPLRWKVGDVTITRITESCEAYPASAVLPVLTPEGIAPHLSWLKPHFVDEAGNLLLSVHGLVIESQGKTIMVDTCIGPHNVEGTEAEPVGAFFENLTAAGLAPEDFDVVMCTHLHFDHVGWNTRRENGKLVPSFPNARYLFARTEWEFWHNAKEKDFASTLSECVQPIIDAGLADLVDMDHVITDEVRLLPTPGHTPGHVGVVIRSGGETAYITGDTIFHPVQFAIPEWGSDADHDKGQAQTMRKQVRETYGDDLVIGTHFAPPTAGHVIRGEEGWQFRGDARAFSKN